MRVEPHSPLLPMTRLGAHHWRVRTPAKLNLFLEVDGRRNDGYHDITTLMLAVDWYDSLEIRYGEDRSSDVLTVISDDIELAAAIPSATIPNDERNLVSRALQHCRRRLQIPPLHIELHKSIPHGAGLGGGSGNAAGMLRLLYHVFGGDAAITQEQLREWGGDLGCDVPFFLGNGEQQVGGALLARGRGDQFQRVDAEWLGGDQPYFVLVAPRVPSETANAYSALTFPLTSPDGPISFQQKTFVNSKEWVSGLFNRFQGPVIRRLTELRPLVEWLDREVPARWSMTGSGSSIFVVSFDVDEATTWARRLATEVFSGEAFNDEVFNDEAFNDVSEDTVSKNAESGPSLSARIRVTRAVQQDSTGMSQA